MWVVKAGDKVFQDIFQVAWIIVFLPHMSIAPLQTPASSTFTLDIVCSGRECACSHTCISVCLTIALLVTGIFLEASPLCLDCTFQPAPIVHWDNTTPPSLPSCKLLRSSAEAGWPWPASIRWGMGWVWAFPRPAESHEPKPVANAASFAAAGNWDTAGTEKINISHLQGVHVSAKHFLAQP